MNYCKNKRKTIIDILLNLSVISSIPYVNASNEFFPVGQKLLLNTTNVSNWNNPYMYMFGQNGMSNW